MIVADVTFPDRRSGTSARGDPFGGGRRGGAERGAAGGPPAAPAGERARTKVREHRAGARCPSLPIKAVF